MFLRYAYFPTLIYINFLRVPSNFEEQNLVAFTTNALKKTINANQNYLYLFFKKILTLFWKLVDKQMSKNFQNY